MNTKIKSFDYASFNITPKTIILENITIEDSANTIQTLLTNAESLITESKIFLKRKQKERAIVFIVAALEEYSKINFLLTAVMFPNDKAINYATKKFLRNFRNHKSKQVEGMSLLEEKLISEMKYLEASDIAERNRPFIEEARQRTLYVDYVNNKFISPTEAFENNKFLKEHFNEFIKDVSKAINDARKLYGRSVDTTIRKLMLIRWLNTTPTETMNEYLYIKKRGKKIYLKDLKLQ